MRALLIALAAIFILIALFVASRTAEAPGRYSLSHIEIADEDHERAQGLSGRNEILPGQGMLFIFPEAGMHGFWMKDMLIPIDIIFINEDGTIAHIADSVSPDSYPTAFLPPHPLPFVLEVRAGYAKEQGWTVGTSLSLPLP